MRFGRGAVAAVGAVPASLALIVADQALRDSAVLVALEEALRGRRVERAFVPAREAAKRLRACEHLWDAWAGARAGRDALVVALGGGLVSDVAGLAAACWHRGVAWCVVPTTTLSMADAALGGKVAVNTAAGKNLVGAVHHPRLVAADLDALASLPPRRFVEGFAEVVKAAMAGDSGLLEAVERAAPALRARDADAAGPLLARALAVKARVVEADAHEASRREILNFGHTAAHALEHVTRHRMSHGEAVAAGVVVEAQLAERLGRLPAGASARAAAIFDALGLRWRPRALPVDALADAMTRDKKSRGGEVRVALPSALGAHDDAPSVAADPRALASALAALR